MTEPPPKVETLGVLTVAKRFVKTKWFSYLTIVLLQLKVIWGLWDHRDLPSADTASYFLTAWEWFKSGHGLITWSPLYTLFYGSLLHVTTDAQAVTILHRIVILVILSILVLALMRQILPAELAWLTAAWWVALPIDFNSLYEVHLFAVIPVVVALLVIFSNPGPLGRGCGVAILLIAAILMRNELSLAAILFGVACLSWEVWRVRAGVISAKQILRAYGIPVIIALACIGIFWWRATDKSIVGDLLRRKHTLNVCQVYAFGYQQRHSDWRGSPWTECQQLMTRIYGMPEPSLSEAWRQNPKAVLEHFKWNIELIPDGLQVLLFNEMSGTVNPDYVPVTSSFWAVPLTLGLCGVLFGGAFVIWRQRSFWLKLWLPDYIWGWIAMACIAGVVPGIILTQRPRPSYLLAFGIIIRALTGLCILAIFHRRAWLKRFDLSFPFVVVLFIVFIPAYFEHTPISRPLIETYQTLLPFHQWLELPETGFVSNGWADDLCSYVGHSQSCRPLNYLDLRREVTPEAGMKQILDEKGATVLFADATMLSDPVVQRFTDAAQTSGWRRVGMRHDNYQNWELLIRAGFAPSLSGEPARTNKAHDIFDGSEGVTLGSGWYTLEVYQSASFRWVNNDAEIQLAQNGDGDAKLELVIEGGPSLNGKPLVLQVFGDNKLLQTTDVRTRRIVEITLPRRKITIRLHTQSENKPVLHDTRILNFRVFRIWTK